MAVRTKPAPVVVAGMAILLLTPGILRSGAAAPAAGPAARLRIEQLSPADRNSLPDGTRVLLGNGRETDLRTLRALHQQRVARFANAAKRGQAVRARLAEAARLAAPALRGIGRFVPPKLVPMVPVQMAAADYQSFCQAAQASGCLYLPAGGSELNLLRAYPGYVFELDSLVTAATCAAEGGIMVNTSVCGYPYPLAYKSNFTPPPPPPGQPIGTGVTSKTDCDQPVSVVVDTKGALEMQYFPDTRGEGYFTLLKGLACTVAVYLPQ